MRIALIGATGNVGRRILAEATALRTRSKSRPRRETASARFTAGY